MCTGCWIPNSLYTFIEIKIRGLCSRSKFDRTFEVLNDQRGYVSYKGVKNTQVLYNPAQRHWEMRLVNNPEVWAVSNASIDSLLMGELWRAGLWQHPIFLLGSHVWTIYNDFHCYGDSGVTTLSFTTCSEDQFTCNNGLCVDILSR